MGRRALVGLVVAAALVAGVVVAMLVFSGGGEPDEETGPGAPAAGQEDAQADGQEPVVETVAEGFARPWGLDFLPEGEVVVTQAPGALSVVDPGSGEATDIGGLPEVDSGGQGGLMDVAVDPDFADTQGVYLTYSAADDSGATSTFLAHGRLDLEEERLEDVEELFTAEPFLQSTDHYGSRVVVGEDGRLYLTVGDRGNKEFDDHPSQDPSNTLGTTLRLEPDGSVPDDNPFVDDPDVADEIYSYGHRNVQGMAVRPDSGELWQSEHGEQDGDEINIVEGGGNHGWPVATTGCRYGTDDPVGDHPSERGDTVDPVHYWECGSGGFPPAGIDFYQGEEFPAWEGDLLVGGLQQEYLARFTVDGGEIEEAEALLEGEGWRIRDVAVSPVDGAIYIAIDADDAPLVRLVDGSD